METYEIVKLCLLGYLVAGLLLAFAVNADSKRKGEKLGTVAFMCWALFALLPFVMIYANLLFKKIFSTRQ